MDKYPELPGFRIESGEALAPRAKPEGAVLVLVDDPYGWGSEIKAHRIGLVTHKGLRLPIKPGKASALYADPERPSCILFDGNYVIAAQAARICGVVLVVRHADGPSTARSALDAVKPPSPRPDPKHTRPVLVDGPYVAHIQAIGVSQFVSVKREWLGLQIELVYTAPPPFQPTIGPPGPQR
jgi:hypothetical protein